MAKAGKKKRISLSVLHEFFHGCEDDADSESPSHLLKEDSATQAADVLTKPLEADAHWENLRNFGMVAISTDSSRPA